VETVRTNKTDRRVLYIKRKTKSLWDIIHQLTLKNKVADWAEIGYSYARAKAKEKITEVL
jgi:hypothetical protein